MRRRTAAAVLSLLFALCASAATLPELFTKAKEQFKIGNYKEALAAVEQLDAESAKPGMEAERQKILPGLLFYKAASLAALGKADEAEAVFESFLSYQPNARLDPALYPPKVIAALDAARKASGPAPESARPAETGVIATAYRAFQAPGSKPSVEMGEDWAKGPAKYLLSSSQRQDFERLSDSLARSEFIAVFWKAHDPKPETPENEYRDEFEKRVAFADVRFNQDETRGSLTDRGMVFILLGPPTYNGRKPLSASDESGAADSSGQSRYGRAEQSMAAHAPAGNSKTAQMNEVYGEGASVGRSASNWIETWHYLRAELPKTVPNQELATQFVTKEGYGKNVLQRDAIVLTALDRAKKASSSGDSSNAGSGPN
jgi:GWxTD domain-containing protein